MGKSFPRRLSISIVNGVGISLLVMFSVVAYYTSRLLSEEAMRSSEHLRDATISGIQNRIIEVEDAVKNAAWIVPESLKDSSYLYHITSKVVSDNIDIVGSAIAFVPEFYSGRHFYSPYSYSDQVSGKVMTKQLGTDTYDYFYMEWFDTPFRTGEPWWTDPYFDDGGGEYLMSTYSYPLKDETGKVYAVFTADISLKGANEDLASIKPYPGSRVALTTASGKYISESNFSNMTMIEWAKSTRNEDIIEIARAKMAGEKGLKTYKMDRKRAYCVYGPLSNGWSVSIDCEYREVLHNNNRLHLAILILCIIALILIYVISYLMIRHLTRPLVDLSQSARNIATGDFHVALPEVKSGDEIEALRDSFDFMQSSINDYINDLKATTSAKERMQGELDVARKIQMEMLPRNFPPRDIVDIDALLEPAKEVGGDFYDFALRKENKLFLLVGDVSGKGVPASLVMSITKSAFRFLGGQGMSLSEMVSLVNDRLADSNKSGMFVTLFLSCLHLDTGEFTFCNAGHNPLVVIPPSGEPYLLKVKPNLAVGLFEGFSYEEQSIVLEKGTKLLFYTDGVTEAETATKDQYGEDRLLAWAKEAAASRLTCEDATSSLMTSIKDFTKGETQNDDITIMTVAIPN